MFHRWAESRWKDAFAEPYVQILFGARQTGKSTLLRHLLPSPSLRLDFSHPGKRSSYLSRPEQLIQICLAMPQTDPPPAIVIDEAQNVPPIFDAVQHLYDQDPHRWRFVLCGSSARKLRVLGTNLLPGRCMVSHLYPLTTAERPCAEAASVTLSPPSPLPWPAPPSRLDPWPAPDLITRLAWGELPGIVNAKESARPDLLRSYTETYLSEELRREALVKEWAAFSRFLQLAAAESGQIVNYSKLAAESGISHPTVKSHYELLEDMFIGFRIPAFSRSSRKGVLSTPRFYFFDLGVRHAAAGLAPSADTVLADPGRFFEHWVGVELWKRLQYLRDGQLSYFRTKDGVEIDFVLERHGVYTPIEVKWTENPSARDARHLVKFLKEHGDQAPHGYIICRCAYPMQIHPKITALPWFCL